MGSLLNFIALAAAAGAAGYFLAVQMPEIRRAIYLRRLTEMRAALRRRVYTGQIPEAPAVTYSLARFDVLIADSPRLSLTQLMATHRAATDVHLPDPEPMTYEGLDRYQERYIRVLESLLIDEVHHVLTRGSLLWAPIAVFRQVEIVYRVVRQGISKRQAALLTLGDSPRPYDLATEYVQVRSPRSAPQFAGV